MVHLANASTDLAAVVGSVGLPGATRAAVSGPSIRAADEHVFAVEFLQAGAVRVIIWTGFVRL